MKPAAACGHAVDSEQAEVRPETRANRYDVVSRLADDLAHEIKNPLNAIVVNLEVLRRKVATGAADAALERANVVDQELSRVHVLVDQLLQLVRPPRGPVSAVSLDEALDDLRPLLELQAKAARTGFQMSADSGVFARVTKDVMKFAVLNLITAIYGAESGDESISVETRASGANAEIVIRSASAFNENDEFVNQARELLGTAGGELEVTGNTAVLRLAACSSFA